jgi:head-tail adaptor
MISSGLTRFRLIVLRASGNSPDSLGRRVTTFTNVGTIVCDVRESAPVQTSYGDGVAVVGAYEIRTRWPNIARLTVTAIDRLQYGTKVLRINGIRDMDQRRRVAVIDCTEIA